MFVIFFSIFGWLFPRWKLCSIPKNVQCENFADIKIFGLIGLSMIREKKVSWLTPTSVCTFSKRSLYISNGADKKNLFMNRELINCRPFSLFSRPLHLVLGWYCKEKLGAGHSWGEKGYENCFQWNFTRI